MDLNQSEDSDSSFSSHEDSDSSFSSYEDGDSDFENRFLGLDPFDKYTLWFTYPVILGAVRSGDIFTVRELLKIPNAIDSRDLFENSPLHIACVYENLEIINLLVSHPDVNLECKNIEDKTPLMESIGRASDAVVIKLLDAGCDIHTQDSFRRTPLQQALEFQQTIVEELLKRGADLNYSCKYACSPLFYAINISSLELVCMLLYYNADTSIRNNDNITPFLYSLDFDERLAYEILPYVVDFSVRNSDGFNCLSLAVFKQHPIAIDILEVIDYESLNQVDLEEESVLYHTLFNRSTVLFKKVFSKIDHNILLKSQFPFLESMLKIYCFSNVLIWLECIYLVASSDVFADLVNICLNYFCYTNQSFFSVLLCYSYFFYIPPDDREKILYIFLSFGVQASVFDIMNYYETYGPCNEINILLSVEICGILPVTSSSFLPYIFGQEVRKSYTDLKKCILAELSSTFTTSLVHILYYFTFRLTSTYLWIDPNTLSDIKELGLEKFQVPSLLELCRNEVRFTIRRAFGITTTNEFYKTVEKMTIPKRLKNLILFKTPLRNYVF